MDANERGLDVNDGLIAGGQSSQLTFGSIRVALTLNRLWAAAPSVCICVHLRLRFSSSWSKTASIGGENIASICG